MLVTLIGKKSMNKIFLPQTAIGNYWITDKTGNQGRKLVNIEGITDNWRIVSNNNAKIINLNSININNGEINAINQSEKIEKEIILKEHMMIGIYLLNLKELFILYCSPTIEENFTHFDIKHTQEIYIGNGIQNHISYQNKMVSANHAKISLNNGRLILENYDTNYGTFVNGENIDKKSKILFNGDVIFIMGLKIIIMGNSLFINNPKNYVTIKPENLVLSKEPNQVPVLETDESDEEVELYSEREYYSRAPRITNIIEKETIKIDAPPQIQDKQETPMILVLGSTLSMGAMMIISMVSTIDNGMNRNADKKQMIFSLIMTFIMLIGIMLFPILNMKYEKKQKEIYEKKRQKRYKDYLNSKSSEISKIKNKQRNILYQNYLSAEECTKIILNRGARLWERKIEDDDFLSIRLGIGDMPLQIEVQYPEKQFAMEDDNLVEILNEIGNNSKTLNGAPIVTSLAEKNVAAFVKKDEENFDKFMQNIMVQLVTFQSYGDLKIVFLLDEDKQKKWEYVKTLPHVWSSSYDIRFFADTYDDIKEVTQYLEEVLKNRINSDGESYKNFMPYYLIITDNYKKIENIKFIKEMLKYSKINMGFSLLCITDDLTQLPNECKTFVEIDNKKGMIFENEIVSSNNRPIDLEVANTFFFSRIWQTIANIPIRSSITGNAALPNNYTFLEMYDVGLIDQLNIIDRWKRNDSTISLKAQVGIDENKMPIVLDIHEKFHGPHGLIAGATGSGKSEFIITYILSLAINYHPDDVAFLLIDYKGGGLTGAFEKKHMKLPHLVGTITNIDTNGLQRSLASIHSEVKRRQVVFNEARNIIDEGTIDIYKYQKLYHDGIVSEPIPHLLIICDEFAELKQQQEEFMDELISISRIGRSLGVHLILATQKPAGIVNDQIRSNSKFAICLKVQDKEDSLDVIKKPDAANLKNAGQFYMQVGNDDYFILGQSAWSGAPYFPSDTTKKKADKSIEFISNTGMPIKKLDDSKQQVVNNEGEQLTNIVKYICNIAEKENIKTQNLWLENVPETIYVDKINKKYHVKREKNTINAVIGEYDDPYNQKQGIVQLDLLNGGNAIIYGNAESGKESLISTMIYDLITNYSSEDVQMYLLDFGSEALKIFKNAPHIGDIIFMDEAEKLKRFFGMIQEEITRRRDLLSNYNGDYKLYLETCNKALPLIVVVINNYEAFNENYEVEYDDLLLMLTREGLKYGITFVTTASSFNDMRYRLGQNFKNRIALQLNKEDDFYNIFEKVGKKRPAHIFGRGLVSIRDEIFEFQTAKVCDAEDYNAYILNKCEEIKTNNKVKAKSIPVLPERLMVESVKEELKDISSVPIGIIGQTLKLLPYDFKKNLITIITSRKIKDSIEYSFYILEALKQLKNVNIFVINAEKTLQSENNNFINEYNELVLQLNLNNKKGYNICVILGIDKFLNSVDQLQFKQTLDKAFQDSNCSFIIVDNANKLKDHSFDDWYKEYISEDSGIWVGNGFDSQYLINITADRRGINDNCGRDFGYVADEDGYIMIKLLGMKKAGDSYE